MEIGACSCGDYDGDPVNVSEVRKIKSRKKHKCDECRRTIKKGEEYWRIKFLSDGYWDNGKRCIQCQQIALDYFCGVLGRGAVWEYTWEWIGVCLRTGKVNGND